MVKSEKPSFSSVAGLHAFLGYLQILSVSWHDVLACVLCLSPLPRIKHKPVVTSFTAKLVLMESQNAKFFIVLIAHQVCKYWAEHLSK